MKNEIPWLKKKNDDSFLVAKLKKSANYENRKRKGKLCFELLVPLKRFYFDSKLKPKISNYRKSNYFTNLITPFLRTLLITRKMLN